MDEREICMLVHKLCSKIALHFISFMNFEYFENLGAQSISD
jgi:hypothetical protein